MAYLTCSDWSPISHQIFLPLTLRDHQVDIFHFDICKFLRSLKDEALTRNVRKLTHGMIFLLYLKGIIKKEDVTLSGQYPSLIQDESDAPSMP